MKTKLAFSPLTGNLDLVTSELNADEVVNVPSGNLTATNAQAALNELQSDIDTRELSANKGVANGYVPLNGATKIDATYLPAALMEFLGTWDVATNTPTLADGTGSAGNVYLVSVGGTRNLGSGPLTFQVGDWVVHNGTIWEQSPSGDDVLTVFGRLGNVVAAAGDYTASQVTNVPSGNLAATDVQAALNELQSDIDILATSSSVTAHTAASTGVHGVTGTVVGTTDTQTLTNKTLDDTSNAVLKGGNGGATLVIGSNTGHTVDFVFNTNVVLSFPNAHSPTFANAAGKLVPATGTNAQQPVAVADGAIRYDSTFNRLNFTQVNNGAFAWNPVVGSRSITRTFFDGEDLLASSHDLTAEILTIYATASNAVTLTGIVLPGANGINGQEIKIVGSSNSNVIIIPHNTTLNTGIRLNGDVVLGLRDTLTIRYDGRTDIEGWYEVSRCIGV